MIGKLKNLKNFTLLAEEIWNLNWNEKMETGRGKLENRKRKSREDTAEHRAAVLCCDVAEKTKRLEMGQFLTPFLELNFYKLQLQKTVSQAISHHESQ